MNEEHSARPSNPCNEALRSFEIIWKLISEQYPYWAIANTLHALNVRSALGNKPHGNETSDGEVWFVVRGGVLMNAKPYGKTAAAPDGEYVLRAPLKANVPAPPACTCTPAKFEATAWGGTMSSGRIDPNCSIHWRQTLVQNANAEKTNACTYPDCECSPLDAGKPRERCGIVEELQAKQASETPEQQRAATDEETKR